MFLVDKIKESDDIMQRAIAKYQPETILVGFTGGSDSLTVLHLLIELGYRAQPFFCNTGIGVKAQWKFIRDHCAKNNLSLFEQGPTYKLYKQIVIQNGFPGPSMHGIIYNDLKKKSIDHIFKFYDKNAFVVTGVRMSESERRKINISGEIQEKDRIRWVSPIMGWDEDDKDEFLDSRKIERSPVSLALGMSYECGCGAYALPGELEMVSDRYPDFGNEIRALEETVFRIGFTWGWDDKIPDDYMDVLEKVYPGYQEMKLFKNIAKVNEKKKQPDLFKPMCHRCQHMHALSIRKIEAGFKP